MLTLIFPYCAAGFMIRKLKSRVQTDVPRCHILTRLLEMLHRTEQSRVHDIPVFTPPAAALFALVILLGPLPGVRRPQQGLTRLLLAYM